MGWDQEDKHLLRFRKPGTGFKEFHPDSNAEDAGLALDTLHGKGYRTFHIAPSTDGRYTAYFEKPEWVVTHGPTWMHAMVRAALRAHEERAKESKAQGAEVKPSGRG